MDRYILGLEFEDTKLKYCAFDQKVEVGKCVVISSQDSLFLGKVTSIREVKPNEDTSVFDKVLREATVNDLEIYKKNLDKEIKALKLTQNEVRKLNLQMSVFRVTYALDSSKVVVLYTADERVDFRELLKSLSFVLRSRVEMRQVGARDRSRLIGGIGSCGLQLCCSSFLSSFDGISINMAKNQMLTLNIPKISGQCGKLMCCLKYEDQAYSEVKKAFPPLNEKIKVEEDELSVTSINVLSNTITLSNKEKRINVSKEDYYKLKNKVNKPSRDSFNEEKKNIDNKPSKDNRPQNRFNKPRKDFKGNNNRLNNGNDKK